LKIENLGNSFVSENVVTALDSFGEAKTQQQAMQVPEADVGIRGSSQYL
jgi:hypothetical protein